MTALAVPRRGRSRRNKQIKPIIIASRDSNEAARDLVMNIATRHRRSIRNAMTTLCGGLDNNRLAMARQSSGLRWLVNRIRSHKSSDQITAQLPKYAPAALRPMKVAVTESR